MGLAEKVGVNQMLKIPSPLFGEGWGVAKERGSLAGQGGHEGLRAEREQIQFFTFFDQFGKIEVSGKVLFPRVVEGVGRGGMLAKGDESAGGAGGVIEVGGGEAIIEGEDGPLLNFCGEKLEPREDGRAKFGHEAFEWGNRPARDFGKEFGRGGAIQPGKAGGVLGDEAFVPVAGAEVDEADGKAIEKFAGIKVGQVGEDRERGKIGIGVDGNFGEKRLQGFLLLGGEKGKRFDQMELELGQKVGVVKSESRQKIEGEVPTVGPLFNEVKRGGIFAGLNYFGDLLGEELAEDGTW